MKDQFLETENYSNLYEAVQGLKDLPASAPKMGLGYGSYGLGKTISLERITVQEDALLFRAIQTWSKTSVLKQVCEELHIEATGASSTLYQRVKKTLLSEPRIIIVDEVDNILKSSKSEVLELFRDIHDETGVIVFFIGMEESRAKFKKHRHYESRIVEFIEFKNISKKDIEMFCALSDIKIEDDLIKYFTHQHPNLRNIRVFLIRLEKICKLNGFTSANLEIFHTSGVNHVARKKN